jgi:hypothetical protein
MNVAASNSAFRGMFGQAVKGKQGDLSMKKSAWRTANLCSIFSAPLLRCGRGSLMSTAGNARRPALNAVKRGDTTLSSPRQAAAGLIRAAAMQIERSPTAMRTQTG